MTHSSSIRGLVARSFVSAALVAGGLFAASAQAAVPGITGPVFNLSASQGSASMPDGAQIYTWAYGCGAAPSGAVAGTAPVASTPVGVAPAGFSAGQGGKAAITCGLAQLPGPTLIVTQGTTVTVNLYNGLPVVAGNTSIVFAGIPATASANAIQGLTAPEAAPGTTVTYTFTPTQPGTYAYYSGTRPELQVEMGLYGALIVLPAAPVSGAACTNYSMRSINTSVGGADFRLTTSAFANPQTCYDREFLFQFHEMDSNIHAAAQACVNTTTCSHIDVTTDPYHPNYFLINGRSFPDDEDPNFSPLYPNQPYNGNPQIHPGELMLLRVIGQGRWQHPFHIHANHGRVLARDGNLLLSPNTGSTSLAGPLYYTVPTVPGQAQDLLFTYTAKGLNWDIFGHNLNRATPLPIGPTAAGNPAADPNPCYPDANGYYSVTSSPAAPIGASNYYEWCADHNKPIPITPPDPQIVANGLWYGGTPYLGLTQIPLGGGTPQFLSTPLPPGTNIQNPSAGYAFMWHSHAERELTTNDVFPGGMLMMMIVQPPVQLIDETL